ncbi:mannan endo-1,4-beta-mannosidase [Sarracenia purpurea var. burkii]
MWIEPSLGMDPFALSVGLKACGLNLNVKRGELLHGYSDKIGFVNSVLSTEFGRGARVFDEMPLRNAISWTVVETGVYRREGVQQGVPISGDDRQRSEEDRTRSENQGIFRNFRITQAISQASGEAVLRRRKGVVGGEEASSSGDFWVFFDSVVFAGGFQVDGGKLRETWVPTKPAASVT